LSIQSQDFDVSVITVVRNGARHIEQTLSTVAAQRGARVEHVVIDGGSTDGTVEILQRHSERLGYWVTEPDRGISDAMNKGAARARGKWFLFLQADDYLTGGDVIAKALGRAEPDAGFIACTLLYGESARQRAIVPTGFAPYLNLKHTLQHQATLIRRDAFARLGGYDTSLRVHMDYDLFLRAMRAGERAVVAADVELACMRAGGLSSRRDWPSLAARFAEERAIHARYAVGLGGRLFYAAWWRLYLPYRYLRSRLALMRA
jgi:glycosyltransferase involved in cell wall biosynthesis